MSSALNAATNSGQQLDQQLDGPLLLLLLVVQQQGLMMLITWSFALLLYKKKSNYLSFLLLLTATGALVANPLNVLTGKRERESKGNSITSSPSQNAHS
jgi:hypothetical protein